MIALASGAAALTFAYKILLPVFEQKNLNEISSLASQVDEKNARIADAATHLAAVKRQLEASQSEISNYQVELSKLETQNIFSKEDPFPAGWRDVRIGDPVSQIEKAYPGVDKDQVSYWSVSQKLQSIFSDAAYYGDVPISSSDQVQSVLFLFIADDNKALHPLTEEQKHAVIEYQLREYFGDPKAVVDNLKRPELVWSAAGYEVGLYPGSMEVSATCETAKKIDQVRHTKLSIGC